jgi:hypothetical protein
MGYRKDCNIVVLKHTPADMEYAYPMLKFHKYHFHYLVTEDRARRVLAQLKRVGYQRYSCHFLKLKGAKP